MIGPESGQSDEESDESDESDEEVPGSEFAGRWTWYRDEQHRGQAVRAIVKDFIDDDDSGGFEAKHIPSMWEDLKTLHALGIVVRDIHMANYLGGKLVDFSRAWTMYHPCLDGRYVYGSGLISLQIKDISSLEDMVDHAFDFAHDVPQECHDIAGGFRDCGTAPHDYNWREKGGAEVIAHVEHELVGLCSDSSEDD
jgi:hypothetical protein